MNARRDIELDVTTEDHVAGSVERVARMPPVLFLSIHQTGYKTSGVLRDFSGSLCLYHGATLQFP
jgi:hypothetical protein